MWKRDNLRKNLLRVKQFADQNLGRSEKSEVLSEDLQSVERRVETVKQICQTTTKKLASNIQSNDKDRRQKKTPEIGLASSLQESATSLGTDTIMGNLFLLCSECEAVNGKEQVLYDVEVENNVIAPLLAILDEEIPTITKLKKNLSRLTLDMDSAKNRWNTAVKQSQLHGTMAQAALKADQIKTEYEDASTKVENGKDMLAVELLNFVARESSHSQCLISYLEAKSQYYKNSLEAINQVLPKMHALIKSNPNKPVYGVAISEHLRVTERDIALPIEACVCTLLDAGLEEEGLFRIGGMASHVKKLASAFDAGIVNMEEFQYDIHAVAGSLKQYLRDLPEPLLTFDLYQDFVNSASLHGDQRLTELWNATSRLPKENYENLRYLIKFMSRVCEKSAVNKMTPSNIAIVLGPNLMWSPNAAPNMTSHGVDIIVAELLVTHSDYFFPGDIDFTETSHTSNNGSTPVTPPSATVSTPRLPVAVGTSPPVQPSAINAPTDSVPSTLPPPVIEAPPLPIVNVVPSPSAKPAAAPNNNIMSTSLLSEGIITSSDSVQYISPKVIRRQSKKPAPRPPDRPHTMIVTDQRAGSHTLPRHTSTARSDLDTKPRGVPPPRPSLPRTLERQTEPIDSGKAGEVAPSATSHKRAHSSDSALIVTNIDDVTTSVTNATNETRTNTERANDGKESKDGAGDTDKSPVSRTSIHRQQRPQPPPPPPPVNKETERTSL